MTIIVFSHKESWVSSQSPTGWATDGGFSIHMDYLISLFKRMEIWVPEVAERPVGEVPYTSKKISITPINFNFGRGLKRKFQVLLWAITQARNIWLAIKQHDSVHVPIPSDIGTIGIWFALLQRKPLYIRYCGNILNLKTPMERYWVWLLTRIAGGRNVVLATGGGQEYPVPSNKNIKWIFSSSLTKESLFEFMKPRSNPPSKKGALKLGYLGRVENGKGIDNILKTLPLLQKSLERLEVKLYIAGDGSIKKELESKWKDQSVIFTGKLSRNEVKSFLQDIDIFIFPSESEGFPKVVLEAMASGLPIVASAVSILPQLVEKSGSGKALKSTSPEDLADAIRVIAEDSSTYSKMSQNAFKEAQKYTLKNWVDQIAMHLKKGWPL